MLFYSSGETTVAAKTAKNALLSGVVRKARQNVTEMHRAGKTAATDDNADTDPLLESPPIDQWDFITSWAF